MLRRRAFLIVYACSGLASLIDEVAWTRLVGLVMGHGGLAAATVLGAFMGGMAAGALVAGRLVARWSRRGALRAYAALEAAVAASALLLPWALSASRPLLAALYGEEGGSAAFAVGRLLVCLACLGVPTIAMGATFPIAARAFVGRTERPGSEAGALYAANTTGAALGALAAGFLLLPALGLMATIGVAALLNALAAATAWQLARAEPPEAPASAPAPAVAQPAPSAPASSEPAAPSRRRRRALAVRGGARAQAPVAAARFPEVGGQVAVAAVTVAVSGAAALASELAWNRLLALVVGPTSYAFGAMLATFIAGLAMGSAAGVRLSRSSRQPGLWLALALATTVVSAWGAAVVVNRLPLDMAGAFATGAAGPAVLRSLFVALGWLLPLPVAFGAAFPLAVTIATADVDGAPRTAASVYAANTAGAIAGALGGGFLLLPHLGLEQATRLIAVAALAAACCAALGARMTRRARVAAVGVTSAALVASLAAPRWDTDLMLGGAYKYAPYLASVDAESALRAGTLLWHADGRGGAVSVRRTAGVLSLAIDGKVDASNGGDMLNQKLLAHVPLLLHEAPRDVLVIGLGSGVTLGAALRHPIARAEVVEISPEVVRAASFFRAENAAALSDPRARLIVGDGRTHLMLSGRRYDVIISEPSNPWISGMSALFTREVFEAARARLAPGGLMCQWAHTYDMRDEDLRSIVATFARVFPETTLWLVGEGDVLLVGATRKVAVDPALVARRWSKRRLAADLARVSVGRPFAVLSLLAARPDDVAGYADGVPIQTDDRLALEYSAPGAIIRPGSSTPAGQALAATDPAGWPDAIGRMWREAGAPDWTDRGRMLLAAEAPRQAFEAFARALAMAPRDGAAVEGLVTAAPSAGRVEAALALLGARVAADPLDVPAAIGLSRLLAGRGDAEQAERVVRRASAVAVNDPALIEQWASVAADARQIGSLREVVDRLTLGFAGRPATAYYAGTLRYLEGRPEEAARLALEATRADPSHARAWGLAGASLASLGRMDEAREAFEAGARANPRDPSVYANLGLMALGAGRPAEAARHFAEALVADPAYAPAREGLASALDAMGEADRARRVAQGH